MLTPEQWDSVGKQASKIYSNLELAIIHEIAKRIANFTFAKSVVLNNIKIAQEMGLLYEDIILLVAKYNETSVTQVKEIFENAGVSSLEFDDRIYREAGLNPLPIKQNYPMWKLLEATAIKTNSNLNNLVMTTANEAQMQFYNVMNKAYMEVSTGLKSYSQAILDSVKELSKEGVNITYPSGQRRSIESAVRMNILTSVNQTCGKLQEMRADELGWDLMEITAHSGARPEHAEWQGKIVSRSGTNKKYLTLEDIGYGEITGFKGVNCRHDWYPYYEGSSRNYSNKELEKLKNETVIYNGKKIKKYEATQIQRKMERQIRNDKKELSGLQGILSSNTDDNELIEKTKTQFAKRTLIYNTHKNQLQEFTRQINTKNDISRTYTSQNKNVMNQINQVSKLADKYNNSDMIGMKVNNVEIKSIGEHIISRTYARSLDFEDVQKTLKKPLDYGKIKIDEQGRRSFNVFGEVITVSINPDTGKVITARKTNKRELKKYGIEE